eukprot:13848620-Alexandrium_andersonii.AAC.1
MMREHICEFLLGQHPATFVPKPPAVVDSDVMDVGAVQSAKGKGKGSRQTCSHCGKTGHTSDTCYELVGYPPQKGAKGKGKSKGKNNNNHNDNKAGSDGGSTRSSSTSSQPSFEGQCH